MSLLSNTNFQLGAVAAEVYTNPVTGANVSIGELETKNAGPDYCPDVAGAADLKDFAFAPVSFDI
jgi:hypothetical protein